MRRLLGLISLAVPLVSLQATTLQQLSLDDMIRMSTTIVRGQTQQTYSDVRNSVIYTHYSVQVSTVLKGAGASRLDIAVPGGTANGRTQTFAGVPALLPGHDYVLFLWTSRSGLTQIIGLSQGFFALALNASGQTMVERAASTERMLDASGQPVTDSNFEMLLSDLMARIQAVLSRRSSAL